MISKEMVFISHFSMVDTIPMCFSPHSSNEMLCDIPHFIQKIKSLLSKNPEIIDIAQKHLGQIQHCSTIEQLMIFIYPLFFELCRSPLLSSSVKQQILSFFMNLFDSMNLSFKANDSIGFNGSFVQAIQQMDLSRKMDIDRMLDPLCIVPNQTPLETALQIKRKKLKVLISNANPYQTQAIYTILANKMNGWDFEVEVDTLPTEIIDELLDMFDDLAFYC